MRIAVIHEASATPQGYTIFALAELWQSAGHEVLHLRGPHSYEPADVALLHVDLSVVPKAYLTLARRYSTTLNLQVTDIRKRHISPNLLKAKDAYTGPVLVKSNLNHAGIPEQNIPASKSRWAFWKKPPTFTRFSQPKEYPIFPSIAEVPRHFWKDPLLVVEKFLPEHEDGFYFLRQTYFLGDCHNSWRLRSPHPIIRADDYLDDVEISTPESLEAYRREIGLDYGKIDYVEHDGKVTVLDVNKTIGGPAAPESTPRLAPGIERWVPAAKRP